jgi:hypothetical protein
MKIDKVTAVNDKRQLVHVTISHGSDKYKYDMNTPVLEGDALQNHCDEQEKLHLTNILYQVYGRNIKFNTVSEWDEWIADGRKIPAVKQEIPAIKKKAAVYEDVEVSPAVEAKDAVMGERQKELSEEEEVTKTVIEKSDSGKYLEKQVTETVVKKIPQYEEVPLYAANGKAKKDEDGNAVMHTIPKMEEYEIEPAVKAKAAVTEKRLVSEAVKAVAKKTLVIKPEAVIEKKAWVDSH